VKHANRLICEGSREVFATACYLTIDPSGECRFALAGHPPPVVTGVRGTRLVEAVAGAPLGVSAGSAYHEVVFHLADDERIVLYTDGLMERRDEDIDRSLARLVEVAHGIGGIDAESLVSAMVDNPLDDVVVLVVARAVDRQEEPSPSPATGGSVDTDPTLPVS
jgi:serine phosphatase RsbU (regulator of sigma subunit)